MITSVRNPKIQWVRNLQAQARLRREEGLFVVEGVRLVEEALQAGWPSRLVLHSPALSERGQALVSTFAANGAVVEAVSEGVLAAASATETPQGLLAVVERRELALPAALDFILVVDALRDPGNLGTIFRTAAAAGAQALVVAPGTVDPFAPKVVRAAMGAHFRLPLRSLDWQSIRDLLKPGLRIYLADAGRGQAYTVCDLTAPLALILGSEAAGVSGEAQALADEHLHIPMAAEVESLNAAAAAAVLLFEVARQRSGAIQKKKKLVSLRDHSKTD
jgi:TrmH family RNA methyltransferase